ncbi:MAG: BlaI/MecI/CopY family transcriptional regulator [Clostridia bacterium]|nr:BlaI/MecI/CopY family transcriptional regulator [Clostridia bacterium]
MTPKIFESEYRFCLILWETEPIRSTELVRICGEQLAWKPTTTYTVIKRLKERGVLENSSGVITSLVSKEEAQQAEIDELVDKRFGGSLPSFIAAFTRRRNMTDDEIASIQRMIDASRKGDVV